MQVNSADATLSLAVLSVRHSVAHKKPLESFSMARPTRLKTNEALLEINLGDYEGRFEPDLRKKSGQHR
ncbi:MAG: hypothetical protein CM1200mP41_05820 [Gammaproteobacteria bacterium]|nr:MAG: hypothetical protein CM1200mP41_05820 [Gammaproteobacteria bacterium]